MACHFIVHLAVRQVPLPFLSKTSPQLGSQRQLAERAASARMARCLN
jgi:hypothetical protein